MTFRFPSVHCKALFPSISREEILSGISNRNWRLPSPYLEFISEHNGMSYKGRPRQLLAYQYAMDQVIDRKSGFKLQFKQWPRKQVHTDHCGFIDELFGSAGDKSPYDIRHQQGCYGFNDSVPANFIAIGGACDTSLVAICLNGEW